jgi:hypothetical protein
VIKVKWSKPDRQAGYVSGSLKRAQALAAAYGEHVRERVRDFARPVNDKGHIIKFRYDSREYGPKNQRRPFFVNDAYAKAAGAAESVWASSAEFHADARAPAGAFYVTGGMWKGLSVISQKGIRSKLYFGGSSLGMRSQKRSGTTKRGKPRAPKKIRNRAKARSVGAKGIHVLQWTKRELDALLLALAEEMRKDAIGRYGFDAGRWSGALINRRLYRKARRYVEAAKGGL